MQSKSPCTMSLCVYTFCVVFLYVCVRYYYGTYYIIVLCKCFFFFFWFAFVLHIRNEIIKKKKLGHHYSEKCAPVCYIIIYILCSGNLHPRKNEWVGTSRAKLSLRNTYWPLLSSQPSPPAAPQYRQPSPPPQTLPLHPERRTITPFLHRFAPTTIAKHSHRKTGCCRHTNPMNLTSPHEWYSML